MRILALDYGKKRIGLALSDPLGMIAQPRGYLENNPKFLGLLKQMIQDEEIHEVVVGMPHSMSGNPSEMTKEVEAFVTKLKTQIPVLVTTWDERLTTMAAEKALISGDVRRKDRKEMRDAVAAALLLQMVLQSKRNG